MNQNDPIRLDKWLWAARFYKTRSLAREMIEGGKVHYNGYRSKPGRAVEIGAKIILRQGSDEKTIVVKQISGIRGNATSAQILYEETTESIEKRTRISQMRKLNALTMPHPDRKPDKKQRRELMALKETIQKGGVE